MALKGVSLPQADSARSTLADELAVLAFIYQTGAAELI